MSHCSRLLRLLRAKTLRLNNSKKRKNAVSLVGRVGGHMGLMEVGTGCRRFGVGAVVYRA